MPRLPTPTPQMDRFEREQLRAMTDVDHWSTYVGTGAPRFVLSFDVQTGQHLFRSDRHGDQGRRQVRDRLKAQFEAI